MFFALFPDDHTAQHIIHLGNTLCRTHALHGRLRPTTHLHVSLFSLGGFSEVPEAVIAAVSQICQPIAKAAHPFEITFNQVRSFRGGPGNRPLVFANDEHENKAVKNFYESLVAQFAKFGHSISPTSRFEPHLTLLYDQQSLAPKRIEPISWLVKELVLIRSEVGATKYERLGHWELGQ